MPMIDSDNIPALAELEAKLPKILKEIGIIEASFGKLKEMIGEQETEKMTTGKKRGRPPGKTAEKAKGKPGPKTKKIPSPKPKAKKAVKKKTSKPGVSVRDKVLNAVKGGSYTAAEMKKRDGRIKAGLLANMVNEGLIKKEGKKYTAAQSSTLELK